MKPFTEDFIKKYNKNKKQFERDTRKISQYFIKIVDTIFDCFNRRRPEAIYFSNSLNDEDMGSPDLEFMTIPYNWVYDNGSEYEVVGRMLGYENEIPIEFLTMTIPKIKKFINDQIENNSELLKEEEKRKRLLENAKNKLTEEELEVLRVELR